MAGQRLAIIGMADLRKADLGATSQSEENSPRPWIDRVETVSHRNLPPTTV